MENLASFDRAPTAVNVTVKRTTMAKALGECLSSERNARDHIIKGWSTFSAADRRKCIRLDGYLPSYVEWVTCLEMERSVSKMRQQEP